MQKPRQPRTADEIARHWQALAERRRQYLLELHRSGRWRRYYTEEQLTALMRDALRNVEEWSVITGEAPADVDNDVAPLRHAAE